MRALWTLLRLEVRRLSRTAQVYTFVLLPALLLLPVGVFLGVTVVSLDQPDPVAVPAHLPAELPLAWALSREDLAPRPVEDPAAAWLSGEVDAAVIAVERREGLAAGNPALEGVDPAAWVVRVLATDDEAQARLEAAVERAGDDVLTDLVVLAGGDLERDLEVAHVEVLDVEEPPVFPVEAGLWAYAVFLVSLVGFFMLALAGVADRNEGVTEALLVTPARAWQVLLARLLATLGLQVVACLLFVGNVVLLLAQVEGPHQDLLRGPAQVASLVTASALCDALYLMVGTWSPNAKAANNLGGLVMTGILGLLGLGVADLAPAWLPLAGVAAASTPVEHLQATGSSALLSLLVVAATAAALDRRVDLKLAAERR
ncbi:ABC transporter permease [Myxococcota bacterium]|nr:ABC transporter permease [Myxococcota bacterium]